MKMSEIQKMSDEQLVHAELKTERELVTATFKHRTQQLDDTSKLKQLRRQIARYRTAQREREREEGLHHDSLRNRYRQTFGKHTVSVEEPSDGASRGFLGKIVDKISGKE